MAKSPIVRLMMLAPLLATMISPGSLLAQQATPGQPSPPAQPASGPGGADYLYDEVVAEAYGGPPPTGGNPGDYWIFEPAAPSADAPLPLVIVFADDLFWEGPAAIRSWIDHIVRKGAVVLVPILKASTGLPMSTVDATLSAALAELDAGHHAPLDLNRVTLVGLNVGAPAAVRLAAGPLEGLPAAAALMLVMPGPTLDRWPSAGQEFAAVPPTTRVVLVGAEDNPTWSGIEEDGWIALAAAGIPAERRAFVTLRSDDHGSPPLDAGHILAMTDEPDRPGTLLDALDWYGTWKLLDGLMGCAFDGKWCEYAFGNTPEQRYMGTWSDGVPVTEAIIAGEPGTPTP